MLRKVSYIYSIYFYAYAALCLFWINVFSTTEYEWMIDGDSIADFCEVPEGDADGSFSFIIVPLSIPFFLANRLLIERNILRIITYLAILMYHSYRFYTRISVCSIAN
ncbi:DUF2645 family protein [Pectobacterium brasiliense]|uniref:DUF2645 family protein n=1 Tax=Pectobacterium brasiliense TaxID=180957 RepID=UPI0009076FC4|nr:DUF2645 family protein [Pectobacterium brasiliense]